MASTLYNQMNQQPSNSPIGFFQALQRLKSMGGDPDRIIQQMLNSGQATQEQYNEAVAKATQLQQIFGR